MDIAEWLARRGGIAHRRELALAGFTAAELRDPALQRIGRSWLALESAPPDLVEAATVGGRVTCVTAARRLGLALLRDPAERHVWVPGNARAGRRAGRRLHRSSPLSPVGPTALVAAVADVLSHVAECLPEMEAQIVWDSALRKGLLPPAVLHRIPWPGPRQRRLAKLATADSDSLLETVAAFHLRRERIPFRQQVVLLGRPVDFLVDERLVLQVDGYEFHRDARQRRSDIEFDARLLAAGRPVIRRDYAGVVHDPAALIRDLRAALLAR